MESSLQQEISQLSVAIPKNLHIALKVSAAQRGLLVKDLVAELVRHYLDGSQQSQGVAA